MATRLPSRETLADSDHSLASRLTILPLIDGCCRSNQLSIVVLAAVVRGACQSRGGKSFIAFTSTAKGGTISKIKSILTPGAVVTTSKNDVDYIVTEYGVAHLRGRSLGERARQLIAIAHPDFRDELTFEAKKRGIMI